MTSVPSSSPSAQTDKSLRNYVVAGYALLIAMLGVGTIWAVYSELNGAVIAPAVITVESHSKKIQHKDGGIVQQILVKDGDHVTQGQPLVILDNKDAEAELTIVSSLLFEARAKKARLDAERDGLAAIDFPADLLSHEKEPAFASILSGERKLLATRQESVSGRKDQMGQQISQLNKQISGIDSQTSSKDRQIEFIKLELGDLQTLSKSGLVPSNRIKSLEREQARLEGERGELVASRASSEAKIAEVKLQMIQVDDEYLNKTLTDLREVESKIAEYSQRQEAAASRIDRLAVKAPSAGVIYQSNMHTVGGVVASGEAMMLLVPEGDDLVLQAQVRPQDIDNIHTGQMASIRFPAFNTRLTPEVEAEVIQVAADVTQVEPNSAPFYSVRLTLPQSEVAKLGDNKLRPGMPAEAFIQTEAHSPLSYFMKPLADQFAHALREG